MSFHHISLFLLLEACRVFASYSFWDQNCSFVYESNSQPGFCSPNHTSNVKNAALDLPCGMPLLAPLTGYCRCRNDKLLSFCPQNVADPFLQIPYERSCAQLCQGLDPPNVLSNVSFSQLARWLSSNLFQLPIVSGMTGANCTGACQMNFNGTLDATSNLDPNLQYEIRFRAQTLSTNSSVSFCPQAYRSDIEQRCTQIKLMSSPAWQSYVLAKGALNLPGQGPFTSFAITRDILFYLFVTANGLVALDELQFSVFPAAKTHVLVLNEFSSADDFAFPTNAGFGASSVAPNDTTPALFVGNSSEHDIDVFYCRAAFFDTPNTSTITIDNRTFYSDFELSTWEASHFHINGNGVGILNGYWQRTANETFGTNLTTPPSNISCVSPPSIFNLNNAYLGTDTICHAAVCGLCQFHTDDYAVDDISYIGVFTTAQMSVQTCDAQVTTCNSGYTQAITLSKFVNPKQDNTLNVSQRKNSTSIRPFSIPNPLRTFNSTVGNKNYVYLPLNGPFRWRTSDFLGFYSPTITNGGSLGFASVNDTESLRFSVLRRRQGGQISVDKVNRGVALQCFGQPVISTGCETNSCHPSMQCTNGFLGAKNVLCTEAYDLTHGANTTNALAFDAFQCETMCGQCQEGYVDISSPRGLPANADRAAQNKTPAANLCVACPGVSAGTNLTANPVCSGNGRCSYNVTTSSSTCKCVTKLSTPLFVGATCNITDVDACNKGYGGLVQEQVGNDWSCSCNLGYLPPDCQICLPDFYRSENTNRSCVACNTIICPLDKGTCGNGLYIMPWGGGCKVFPQFEPIRNGTTVAFKCKDPFPGLVRIGPNCSICNPSVDCNGQRCNESAPSVSCICDERHTGSNCSSCASGYFGPPDCFPCPSTCANCTGNLASPCGTCAPSYRGPYCQYSDAVTCGGKGNVTDTGTCNCLQSLGWSGPACDECLQSDGWYLVGGTCQKCNSMTCNGRGTCEQGRCQCDAGFDPATNCSSCLASFFPPGVCTTTCNSTTCNGRGSCDANGQCSCVGNSAGNYCEKCVDGYWLNGASCVTCAGSPPCGGPNVGVCSTNGTCQCLGSYAGTDCLDPVITGVRINARKLFITGAFFGPASNVTLTGTTTVTCTVLGITDHIECDCPPLTPNAMWSYDVRVIRNDGKRSSNFSQLVALPSISSTSFLPIPASGGVNITLTGSNFGLAGGFALMTDILGNSSTIPLLQQTDNQIVFLAAAGAGSSTVSVKIGSTLSQNSVVVNYLPPNITSISPLGGPTAGQTNLVVQGQNFGPYASLMNVMFENGASCIVNSNCSFSQSSFCCSVPPGFGKMKLSLSVASQSSVEPAPIYYLYDAPQISSVSGCPTPMANGTAGCDPVGGTRITITGANFGDALSLPIIGTLTVTVGGVPCTNLNLTTPHSIVTCLLPAGFGTQKSVRVARVGRVSQAGASSLVSYAGPSFTPSTIKLASSPSPSVGFVVDPTTSGGLKISFGGQGFGAAAANLKVRYGPASSLGTLGWQDCIVNEVSPTAFNCTTGPGVGKNLVFQATLVGTTNYSSDFSSDFYSYPSPSLTASKLGNSFSNRSATYTSQVADGELLYMSGTNLGTQSSLVRVFYGPNNSPLYPCTVQTVTNTELTCLTSVGSGVNLSFRVEVGFDSSSMQVANGTDLFSFPAVPTVSTMTAQGCGIGLTDCPSDAVDANGVQISLVVSGTNLANVYQVLVGDQSCGHIQTSDTLLSCRLPKGVGANRRVLLLAPRSRVVAPSSISYSAPMVSQVSGCTDFFATTLNCPRAGTTITVRGKNFGLAGARVLIGSSPCTGVIQNSSTLTCTIPAMISTFRLLVNVLQGGQMSTSNVYLTYTACSPGFEDRDGVCTLCALGQFSSGSQCVPCAPGSFSSAGASACLPCDIGKYTSGPASSCSACAAGRSTVAPGQGQCIDCPTGKYSSSGGPCDVCPLGTYQASISGPCQLADSGFVANGVQTGISSSARPLVPCSFGTYALSLGGSLCSLCAPGKFSFGNGNSSSCTDCAAGTFQQSAGQSSCAQCPNGLTSLSGSASCRLCPAGRFGVPSGTTCTACSVGMYSPIPGLLACLGCPRGKYGNTTGLISCSSCPAGTYSASANQVACTLCPVMTFSSFGATICTGCSIGSFENRTGVSQCSGCDPGRYLMPNMTCGACPMGRSSSVSGLTRCEACVAGRYANSTGAVNCDFCPAGYYTSNSTTQCSACPPGTQTRPGQMGCVACLPGTAANGGPCVSCQPGRFSSSPSASVCSLCDPGSFAPLMGTEFCFPCGPGKYTNSSGASSCPLCPPATFSPGNGQPCKSCPRSNVIRFGGPGVCQYSGEYSSGFGASKCQPCPIFSCTEDGTVCDPSGYCTEGNYLDLALLRYEGMVLSITQCFECAPGKFSTNYSTVCSSCVPGEFYNKAASMCVNCTAGTYSNGSACIACPSGRITNAPRKSSCIPCPAGRWTNNSITCTHCPAGTFSEKKMDQDVVTVGCSQCLAGRYASQPGQYKCAAAENGRESLNVTSSSGCPAGTHHVLEEIRVGEFSATRCQSCDPGYFSEPGATFCVPCPLNYISNASASTSCFACQGGYVSSLHSTICQRCDVGKYAAQGVCQSCAAGKYANETNLTSCYSCSLGRFSSSDNSTGCSDCAAGSFNFNESAVGCQPCPSGEFQNRTGQSSCQTCGIGTKPSDSRTGCESCGLGSFNNDTGCRPCSPGSYSNVAFATVCSDCILGYYSPSGSTSCTKCDSGFFRNSSNQYVCESCPPGTASIESRLGCTECPEGQASDAAQTSCVICPKGMSSNRSSSACTPCEVDETTLEVDNTTVCHQCVPFAIPELQNKTCQCIQGYYQAFTTNDIYRPENLVVGFGDSCRKCPDGMFCDDARRVSFDSAVAKEGYWCERAANQTDPRYYICPVKSYCLGGPVCACADNRAGVLCSVCRPGFHMLPDNSCAACPDSVGLSLFYVLGISAAAAIVMSIVYAGVLADDRFLMVEIKKQIRQSSSRKLNSRASMADRSSRAATAVDRSSRTSMGDHDRQSRVSVAEEYDGDEVDAMGEARSPVTSRTQRALLYKRRPKLMGQMKIILGFFQITSHLTRELHVPWPSTYLGFISVFSVTRIDLLSIIPASCVGQLNYYEEFTFVALVPVSCIAILLCFFLLPRLAKDLWFSPGLDADDRKTKIDTLIIKTKKLCLFTLFALYPTVSVNATQLFICVDVVRSDGIGVSYLAKDVNLVCHDSLWDTYVAWGVVSLLVYSAGIPILFFLLLLRNKPDFSEKKIRYQLGFVYEAYAPNIWFFEVVDMCHKFLLTCFIFLVGNGRQTQQVQVILGMVFSMSYLAIILLGNPYVRPTDDRLHKLAQVLIFLLLLAALNQQRAQDQLVVRTDTQKDIDEVLGSTFLITVTIGFLLVLLYQIIHIFKVGLTRVLNRVRAKQEERIPTLNTKSVSRDTEMRAEPSHTEVEGEEEEGDQVEEEG